ncbi:hypothetical protein DCAR_0519682 [Daucus carota subsp. sativus]|uniref:Uncharacterized protein n=1 Tax=Daucus carota subsp. sativus TaxID=79200 RepID=A0A162A262_DAUCS|nr:hypothetical protein DCAR_0519682 [Daucus carota subsp. sativus]
MGGSKDGEPSLTNELKAIIVLNPSPSPYRLHKEPHWLMEFRDEEGLRRLNETIKGMREMLDINVEDEAEFYRQLQL